MSTIETMRKGTGFTLVELMITVAVAGILLTVAVPSMRTIILNNRVTSQSNAFLSALVVARSEAIKRNRSVLVTSKDTSDASNEWGKGGWRIWVDDNGNGTFDAASDTLIRQAPEVSSTFVIDAEVNDITELSYQANGFSSATDTFAIKLATGCPGTTDKTIKGQKINISSTGRASSTTCSCDSAATNAC